MQFSFKWSKVALTLLLAIIISNLAYLNYQILFSRSQKEAELPSSKEYSPISSISSPQPLGFYKDSYIIASNSADLPLIYDSIREATASLTVKVDNLSKTLGTTKNSVTKVYQQNKVHEYIIPLGSGSSTANDWSDINGIESYIDPRNYGVIKDIYFEAALSVPTGNGRVYARVKNVTDNIGLIESEIFQEGVGGLVSSGKLPVPNTTKLYRVQLKSTLGANVLIDNARMKIYVE